MYWERVIFAYFSLIYFLNQSRPHGVERKTSSLRTTELLKFKKFHLTNIIASLKRDLYIFSNYNLMLSIQAISFLSERGIHLYKWIKFR